MAKLYDEIVVKKRTGWHRTETINRAQSWGKKWLPLHLQVKELLTPEEYTAAKISTINAHYTSREIISGLWKLAKRLGFAGGRVLEPSAGVGHFLGLIPDTLAERTQFDAVELDSISGQILQKLYPQAGVQVTGFEEAQVPNNHYDLLIGNVPFAKDGPRDSRYPNFSLHNYFLARGIDAVKPGGLMVAITSMSTMDGARSKEAREWIAQRADLVGAIRLPNNAFKQNAGTEVTTDILIFRKRGNGFFADAQNWLNTVPIKTYDGKDTVAVNEYFAMHPEMMLGRMSLEGKMYSDKEPALLPHEGRDLEADLLAAIERLPANVFGAQAETETTSPGAGEDITTTQEDGAVIVEGDGVYVVEDGRKEKPGWASTAARRKRAIGYVKLREALQHTIRLMSSEKSTDAEIAEAQKTLNDIYDKHVARHGPINGKAHSFLQSDPDFSLVAALEDAEVRTVERPIKTGPNKGKMRLVNETTYTKADIFTRRTIFPERIPESADTIVDAIAISQAYKARIDPAFVARLRGISVEEATRALAAEPNVFADPETGEFELSDQYLSGNVRKKLEAARRAAESNPAFQRNVDALEKAIPPDVPFRDITARLGATWLPPQLIQDFIAETIDVQAEVVFEEKTGHWLIANPSNVSNSKNTVTWAVADQNRTHITGLKLIEQTLNLKSPTIYDKLPDGSRRRNDQATIAVRAKQQELREAFKEWVSQKTEYHPLLERSYNDRFNSFVLRKWPVPNIDYYPRAS
ncbi:MAG: hypothetical protein D6781_06530, partial [Verrucomicrobia bacterium]